jgi:protein gp37
MRHEAWKAGNFPTAPKQYHKPFSEVQVIPERLSVPLSWRKPRRVFVNSMADFFHAEVDEGVLIDAFAVMALCPQHQFQILTKRPKRMSYFLSRLCNGDFDERVADALSRFHSDEGPVTVRPRDVGSYLRWPLHNVWMGVSVESQDVAWRIGWLVRSPAAVRFLSCEPLLGPLDLGRWMPSLDWIITGGESGAGFRALDPDWARSIRDQCLDHGVAYFHKQNGGRTPKAGGRLLDGREWNQMPEGRA